MSFIIDALEKAQKDKEKKRGEITEEVLFRSDRKRKEIKKIVLGYIVLLFVGMGMGVGILLFVFNQKNKRDVKVQNINDKLSLEKLIVLQNNKSELKKEKQNQNEPLYVREITLPNGLYLKVDGVYMDNKIPYAMIGPYIVKKGDYIENVVKITYIDFIKVGIEYKDKKYYLLVK